jgi:hypothetical protein
MTFRVLARAGAGAIQAGRMLAVVTAIRRVLRSETIALLVSAILRETGGEGIRIRHWFVAQSCS